MGLNFPSAAVRLAKRFAVASLSAFLHHLRYMFLVTLVRSGLGGGDEEPEPLEESNSYVLVMDGATPSLVHVQVLIALIKKRVPVVEYCEFLERNNSGGVSPEAATRCAVCLSGVEKRDEIRELEKCSHVFHRQCLDCWVDLGHVTCPLCRSLLLPPSSSIGMMIRAAGTSSSSAAATSPDHHGGRDDIDRRRPNEHPSC